MGELENWINIDKERPTKTGHVLALVNDVVSQWQEVLNCYICPEYGNIIWEYINGEDYPAIVSHWMPLPNMPKAL